MIPSESAEQMASPTAISYSFRQNLRNYWEMTRPRVLLLVLITGVPTLFIGQAATPTWQLAFWILFGTALSGAACSVLNAYLERDIDARMARTQNRPLPTAAVSPSTALFVGILLAVGSTWLRLPVDDQALRCWAVRDRAVRQ